MKSFNAIKIFLKSWVGNFFFMLRALRYRNYRLFFIGQLISLMGTWITNTATAWLMYRLTHSAFWLGMVGFCSQLPAMLLMPLAGLFVDRLNKHKLLLAAQVLSMIQSLVLAALTLTGNITVEALLFLSVFQGLINAFEMPCRQSFVVELIEKKQDLGNAIALNSSMFNMARLVGPAVGGVIIAIVGEGICFLIDGLSYIAVIVSLSMMTLRPRTVKLGGQNKWGQFMEGVRYVKDSLPIRSIIILIALMSLVGVPYTVLLPIYAGNILGGGPHTLGFLMSATGLGALIGALVLASRRTVVGLDRWIPASAMLFGVGLVLFALSTNLAVSMLLLVVTSAGFLTQMAACNTILQTIVDDDKRGRVMSLYITAFIGLTPFGSLIAGSFSEQFGAPATLCLCAAVCLTGAFWFYRRVPRIKDSMRPIYVRLGIIPEVASGLDTVAELSAPPED